MGNKNDLKAFTRYGLQYLDLCSLFLLSIIHYFSGSSTGGFGGSGFGSSSGGSSGGYVLIL